MVAVNDARVVRIGVSPRLGNYIKIQDAYGNTYTYGRLAKVSRLYAAPKPQKLDPAQIQQELKLPAADAPPTEAASETEHARVHGAREEAGPQGHQARQGTAPAAGARAARPPAPSSDCSRIRRAPTRPRPAAPSRSSCARAASRAR